MDFKSNGYIRYIIVSKDIGIVKNQAWENLISIEKPFYHNLNFIQWQMK